MPQTLIAIMSMMVASLFAYNQHRSTLSMRMGMVNQDMEIRTTSVAVDLMEEIGSMEFDEATKSGILTSPLDLVFNSLLGGLLNPGETGGIDDIDDYDGVVLQRTRMHNGHTLQFTAEAQVEYVNEDGTSTSGVPSKFKKVELSVVSDDIAFSDTVRIEQIFACGGKCDW